MGVEVNVSPLFSPGEVKPPSLPSFGGGGGMKLSLPPVPKLSLPSLPTGEQRAAPPPQAGSPAAEYALDGKDSFGERGAPPPPPRAAKAKEYTLEERLKARLSNTTPEEIEAATRAKEKAARGRPWIEEAAIKGGGAVEKAKEAAIQEEAAQKAEAEAAAAEKAAEKASGKLSKAEGEQKKA